MSSLEDRVYMHAEAGDPQALEEVAIRIQLLIQSVTGEVSNYRRFRRADPARMADIIWNRMKHELDNPSSAVWKEIRFGRTAMRSADKGLERLIRRRAVDAGIQENRLADNRTESLATDVSDRVFEAVRDDDILLNGLAVLGEQERLPLYCHLVKRMPFREIAAVMGVPESTVRRRMNAAIERVRHAMSGFDE